MPRTVRRQYDTLRAIFNAAVDATLIARSPCHKIHLPEPDPVVRAIIDGDDLERLAEALGDDFSLMPRMATELGLRWGEVAGSRVCDINFRSNEISVFEQRTRGEGGRMVTRRPKSRAGRRTIAVSVELMAHIRDHLVRRAVPSLDSEELLFVDRTGDGLDYSNWYHRVWVPATFKIKRPGLEFHDLRRTNATGLVQAGIDIKTAQKRLGHSDPRLTIGVYAQATEAADRAAAAALSSRFRPGQSAPVHSSRGLFADPRHDPSGHGSRKGTVTREFS